MSNIGFILFLVGLFVVCLVLTLWIWHCVTPPKEEDPDEEVKRSAEELRSRAEENVKSAKDAARRAQRLEELLGLQRRRR